MTTISGSFLLGLRASLIYVPKVSLFTLRCLYCEQTGRVQDQTACVFVCAYILSQSLRFGVLGSEEMEAGCS